MNTSMLLHRNSEQVLSNALISVRDISADYGRKRALAGVSFNVKSGEIFGLVGLNGAGKTTLIKIILGLMEAAEGQVSVFGMDRVELNVKEKIAYLPEKFEPPSFLSGLEFINFSLNLYNRKLSEDDIFNAADRLGLDREVLSKRVNTYSKGMRQKVGLMATLLTGCPLLILDEPMSGLDPRARVQIKDEVLHCRGRGVTVFLSSHILSDMDEICDRIAVIDDGGIVFIGTPQELKQNTGQEYLERAFLQIIE